MFIEWWMLIAFVCITGLFHMYTLRKEYLRGYMTGGKANMNMLTSMEVISVNQVSDQIIVVPSQKGIKINANFKITSFNHSPSNRIGSG